MNNRKKKKNRPQTNQQTPTPPIATSNDIKRYHELSELLKSESLKNRPQQTTTKVLQHIEHAKLLCKQIQNHNEKPDELNTVLRVVGHLYLKEDKKAKQLYLEIKDRLKREETVIHHEEIKLFEINTVVRIALKFIITKQTSFALNEEDKFDYDEAINILKYFHIQILLQIYLAQRNLNIIMHPDKKALQLLEDGVDDYLKDCRNNISEKSKQVTANGEYAICVISLFLEPIKTEFALLHDVKPESLIKFNEILEKLAKLITNVSHEIDVKFFSPMLCVLNHQKLLIENKREQLLSEQKFQILLKELEAKRNNRARVLKSVKRVSALPLKKPAIAPVPKSKRRKGKSAAKHDKKEETVNPHQLMNKAYQLLQSTKFNEAEKLYEEALRAAQLNNDILAQVQALLTLAECYELWFKSLNKDKNEMKDKALAAYQNMIAFSHQFRETELEEAIIPYLAFANYALEKLQGKKIVGDVDIESQIKTAKYDEVTEETEKTEKNTVAESLPTLELTQEEVQPCYKRVRELPIDADILSLMNDISDSYAVGGAIRDFWLERQPRDIDVVTSLTPAELVDHLTKLSYRCEIVSKMFPIVLVTLPTGKVVEVATFRGIKPEKSIDTLKYHPDNPTVISNTHYALHPSVDTSNRDTTTNCLYYNPRTHEIFSYCPETESDLESKTIRIIGNPEKRFGEDPIIMLRVLELSYRLGFTLDVSVCEAIEKCKHYLSFVPPGRLLHQCHKIFYSGNAKALFDDLIKFKMLDVLIPHLSVYLFDQDNSYYSVLSSLLLEADFHFYQQEPISYPLLFASLLWPLLLKEMQSGKQFADAANDVLNQQGKIIKILPFMCVSIKNMWVSYLKEKAYFLPRIANETVLQDHQQTCLAFKFSQSIDYYTTRVMSQPLESKHRKAHKHSAGLTIFNEKNFNAGSNDAEKNRSARSCRK